MGAQPVGEWLMDPVMNEILRRQFQRRRPGEVRGNFPMPQDVPPGMAPAPVAPPPSVRAPDYASAIGAPPLPAAPPGPMPMPPTAPMPVQAPVRLNAGYGAFDPSEVPRVPYAAPPAAQPAMRLPSQAPMTGNAGGADDLNSLVLALMQGQQTPDTETANRLRALMGYASNAPMAPGMG